MKHLFIINPAAKKAKGRVSYIKDEIDGFFKAHPGLEHDVYVSAWCRDAVSYVRRYIIDAENRGERVRVHAIGGTGTLFEVVNGVIGLSNAEVAAYPYGRTNAFLKYYKPFGNEPFASIEKQVSGKTVPIDAVRCGNNYGVCFGIAGLEAQCDAIGDKWIEKGAPVDLSFMIASIPLIISGNGAAHRYRVEIDGQKLDGEYLSIYIANTPCYGQNLYPGIEAHPDDGTLEVYIIENTPKPKILREALPYLKGKYKKTKSIRHLSGKRIALSSDEVMCMNIDSETFYGTSIEYEVVPGAIRFVLPDGIELGKLPRVYNRPGEGLRGER